MKRVLSMFLLTMLSLSAADFSGKWTGQLKKIKGGPDSPDVDEHYLVLEQKGTTVTGTAGPQRDAQFKIQNVKIDGARLMFDVSIPGAGLTVAYDLSLSNDAIAGSMISKQGPEIEAKLSFKRE